MYPSDSVSTKLQKDLKKINKVDLIKIIILISMSNAFLRIYRCEHFTTKTKYLYTCYENIEMDVK